MIKLYSHAEHFERLKAWNDARGQHGLEPWMLPDLGFVSDERAIAFLVTTNSPVAWLAHWCVDPKLDRSKRNQYIGELVDQLEKVSKEKGFTLTQTLGKVGHNLSEILKTHGYHAADGAYSFFVKDIRS